MPNVKLEWQSTTLTAHIFAEVDHHTAAAIRPEIDRAILAGAPQRLVFNLAGVTFMDSSGVGLILGRQRLMENLGGTLAVRGASSSVGRMLRLSGVEKIVEIEREATV